MTIYGDFGHFGLNFGSLLVKKRFRHSFRLLLQISQKYLNATQRKNWLRLTQATRIPFDFFLVKASFRILLC